MAGETTWWFVYEGKNSTKKQIYYGVSSDTQARIDGSHCVGGTKALKHWDCKKDKVTWSELSRHKTKERASGVAQGLETSVAPRGYTIIQTGGT